MTADTAMMRDFPPSKKGFKEKGYTPRRKNKSYTTYTTCYLKKVHPVSPVVGNIKKSPRAHI